MIRLASLFWLALVAVTGFATFKVKYAVQDIEDQLNKVRRHTIAEQQEIHVLRAEWTALNQPERLADLNRRFLSLAAVAPKQLQRKIQDIPLRPPPPCAPVVADERANRVLETCRTRLVATAALFAVVFAVVVLRLAEVTLLSGGSAESHVGRLPPAAPPPPARADIVDRNGALLA